MQKQLHEEQIFPRVYKGERHEAAIPDNIPTRKTLEKL
jgi:hypothetical protein